MKNIIFILTFATSLFLACIEPSEPNNYTEGEGGYKIIGRYATKGAAQDVVVNGKYAYIAQGEGGLAIVDISAPESPKETSVLYQELRGYSSKIAYKDSAVYLSAGAFGLNTVDVKSPQYPVVKLTNVEMKTAKSLLVYNNFLLAGISEKGVKIARIPLPATLDPVGSISVLPGFAQSMYATKDSILLVACGEMGLALVDISNLVDGFESYALLGWIDLPGYAEDISVAGEGQIAILACGTAGLQVIDFSDINKLKVIGSYDPGGYAKEIACENNTVYMTTEKNGLKVFNLENPAAPKLIGSVPTKYAMGLFVSGNFIYVADDIEGLIVIKKP